MAEITSTSRHLSGMVRVCRHAGSGRGAIATAVDLSGRVPCVADVVGTRVAKIAFSSRSRGLFGSTSTVWALGLQLQLSPPHLGVDSSCLLARVSAPSGVHRRAVLHVSLFRRRTDRVHGVPGPRASQSDCFSRLLSLHTTLSKLLWPRACCAT